jgi:hypothetical protein
MFPEMLHAMQRFQQEMKQVDEVAHVLLKGHLLIEEGINRILDQYVFHREHLQEARLSFHAKVLLARGFGLRKNNFGEWELIGAINSLRNTLAHSLQAPERAKKLANVKAIYFREVAGFPTLEHVKTLGDPAILSQACSHCGAFLASYEGDSKAFRKMVYEMDRSMNPDLPPFEL